VEQQSVIHSTFVIERHYPATPDRIFAAFSDPDKKRRWHSAERGMDVQHFEMDFRVGGVEQSRYQMGEDTPFPGAILANDTTYQDIVPCRRIVTAYTMSLGDRRFSASLATFEFLPVDGGTDLVFTEQGAYFEGADGPKMREEGWRTLLDQVESVLAR
jgi:uncharacterized protein YndB with AHSA1/START domain